MPFTARRFQFLFIAALICLASCATPRVAAHGERSPEAQTLRVVTYNIKHGRGMDGHVDLDRIAAVLRPLRADVILLQEIDQGCARSGEIDQPATLGSALGMAHRFGPFRPYDGGLYGMAILTRLPILRSEVVALPPGPNALAALELQLALPGAPTPLTVTGLHLVQTEPQRLAQASFLRKRYTNTTQPVIVAGDLNSEPASPVLAEFLQLFDAPTKSGNSLTFPSIAPVKEIDYVLLAPKGQWAVHGQHVIDEPMASDHRPVLLIASHRY